jgi:hypothetical protein
VVDCTGLENRQTERFPGFESLSFRQVNRLYAALQPVGGVITTIVTTEPSWPTEAYSVLRFSRYFEQLGRPFLQASARPRDPTPSRSFHMLFQLCTQPAI